MSFTTIQNSFITGELSPATYGRTDLAKYKSGATTYRNFFVGYRGGAYSRPGLAYVSICKQPATAAPPRDISFQFNNYQGFALEFGDNYMRIKSNGAYVTEAAQNVTGITQANPGVITITSHGYSNGDWVYGAGIGGMTAFNGLTWIVANKTTNTFTLTDLFGNAVNTNVMPAFTSGGTFARIYTLATPYAAVDLPYLKYVQSADTMTLDCVNPNTLTGIPAVEYPIYNLVRNGAASWALTPVSYASAIAAPANCAAVATSSTTQDTFYSYVVTAVDNNGNESVASNTASVVNNDIAVNAGSNTITWSPVAGAVYYNIYAAIPLYSSAPVPIGVNYGFMGEAFGTSFVDTNITPDFTDTPPTHQNPFARGQIVGVTITAGGTGFTQAGVGFAITTSTGSAFAGSPIVLNGAVVGFYIENNGLLYANTDTIAITQSGASGCTATLTIGAQSGTYPGVPAYLFQRAVHADTLNNPDTYFMTKPGQYLNMDSSIPITDGDAIIGNPWAQQVNGIQFIQPMLSAAVIFTGGGTWLLSGGGGVGTPFTPTSQQATPQEYNGSSSTVPPIPINSEIIYLQSLGSIVRDLSYNYFTQRCTSIDVTVLSSHLFEGYQIVQWAYAQNPFYLIWAVRNDGMMLSFTFIKEQEVQAWSRHDTNGLFMGVCTVTEPPVNAVYCIVKRLLNGSWHYVSERFDNRLWQNVEDCFCVDAGLSYPMTEPAATLTPAAANGTSNISAAQVVLGGSYPNQDAVAIAVDSSATPGSAATFAISYSGNAISAVTPVDQGEDYTPGQTQIVITSATGGSGAIVNPIITNIVQFTASTSVFNSGMVGDVIRVGNGKAAITSYVSGTEVMANITVPITQTVPNDPMNTPIPQTSGNWTISTPTSTVTGLNHLIGLQVTGLADGGVIEPTTVVNFDNGTVGITLPVAASAITVGLPFLPQIQSTYLDPPSQSTVQSKRKSINAVALRIENTAGISSGTNQKDAASTPGGGNPVWNNMTEVKMRNSSIPAGQPVGLQTGDFYLSVSGGWNELSQVAVEQPYPIGANLSAIITYFSTGDSSG